MQIPEIVSSYLAKYGKTGWSLAFRENRLYNNAVVIPVLAEYSQIKKLLFSLSLNDRKVLAGTIIIFIINNLKTSAVEFKDDNQRLIRYLHSLKEGILENHGESDFPDLNLNYVDAASEGKELPDKNGGVGFARKIGMDLALTLFDYTSDAEKILISLDADCTVNNGYLSGIVSGFNNQKMSSAVINFAHPVEEAENKNGIIIYEIFLRYYVLSLKYAGSKYAFHTIGSAFACNYETYIKAEGMNQRQAGEDFYFLMKAAKNSVVSYIKSSMVYPSARSSVRAPFGTGQKVARFNAADEKSYLVYNPESFLVLKDWINLFHNRDIRDPEEYLSAAEKINIELYNFLLNQNFREDFSTILNNFNPVRPAQLETQKLRWFDGFRTLKLIHHLRDTAFPLTNIFDAADKLFLRLGIPLPARNNSKIPEPGIPEEYLDLMRKYYL